MPGFSCPVYSRKLSFEIQKRADGRDRRRSSWRAVAPADCSLSSLNSHPADAEPRSRRRVCRAAAVWGLDLPVRRSELRCRGLATSTPARPTPARPGADHRVAHARAARMGVSGAEPKLDDMSRVFSQTQFRDSKVCQWAGPAAVISARSGAGRLLTVKPQLASGRRGAAQPTSGVPGGRGLGLRLASQKV